jgi:hydroxyacylglutathione hydrolase
MINAPIDIEITPFLLGPIENNSFLIADSVSREAAVIDPSFDIEPLVEHIKQCNLQVKYILITHAHFDHTAGVNPLLAGLSSRPELVLHQADLDLWKEGGDALQFGFQLDPLPNPDRLIVDNEKLSVGSMEVLIHHTPGHSPGHVVFSFPQANAIFVGDVIFAGSIGRTDLAGGNLDQLLNSIHKSILTYPDTICLYPGHGPETTVGIERQNNPFLI